MYKTIDINGNTNDYDSKLKIKRCMLDLISLSRKYDCKGENSLGQRLKKDIDKTM